LRLPVFNAFNQDAVEGGLLLNKCVCNMHRKRTQIGFFKIG